jgi:L-alanine-DL-glutamate epimerase-like enolase superfamily enzyme
MNIRSISYDDARGDLHIDADDAHGICPCSPETARRAIELAAAADLTGADPLRREQLWQRLTGAAAFEPAVAALDIALWDLAGRAHGLPVFRVIGGFRTDMPVLHIGAPTHDPDAALAQARAAVAAGARAFCDRFTGPPARVASLAARMRAAVGDDVFLMHDGQRRYDRRQALAVGRALTAHDYHWFRAPLAAGDAEGTRRLAAALDVPILDGVGGSAALRAMAGLAATQAADLLAVHVRTCGGITGALKLARMAEAFGLHCEFEPDEHAHPLDRRADAVARAHLMAAVRNAQFYAVVDDEPPLLVDGAVSVPTAPGMGWE